MAARKFQPSKNRERINFAISDLKEFKRELEEFGVKAIPEGQERIVVTMRDSEQRRFIMDKSFRSVLTKMSFFQWYHFVEVIILFNVV